jgi:hypothetical protein
MSQGFTEAQIEAAQKFAEFAHGRLQGTNIATIIAGLARMAGTFLFRSFGFELKDVKPGSPILSVEANEKGPHLMQISGAVLSHLGIHIGEPSVQSNHPEHTPALDFLDTQKLLEPKFDKIRRDLGLSLEAAAEAAAAAVGFVIKENGDFIDHNVAFGVAVYGFIEGTKTVPLPLPESTYVKSSSSSIRSFARRLFGGN